MEPLPKGRHGLSREFVDADQRQRLQLATAVALAEHGYEQTTVALIGKRAHVSKSDFYRHFASKDECFLAAYRTGMTRLRAVVLAACKGQRDWAGGVCAALAATLTLLRSDPPLASLLLVEGLRAGPEVCGQFQESVASFVPYLRDGLPAGAGGGPAAEAADEAVVGGIASLIGRRVLAGEAESLEQMFPEVAEFALTPYIGVAEARRVISSR